MLNVAEQMEILRRNTVEILPEGELEMKLKRSVETGKPLIVKQGFDPTAPDIHLGHTVGLRKLRGFSDLGHRVVVIIGDYTAQVGDPSGRSVTRPQLSREEVEANAATYLKQFFKVLEKDKVEVRRNGEWFADMSFAAILGLAGKMTLARMLERDDFAKRWQAEQPISIHELLYPLMQAYDSVAIKADVEIGATEQKFNLLTGRQIQELYGVEPQVAMTLPVLEGVDGVQRMSKSIGNYIGVAEPPREIFGKIMSIPDRLIVSYFELVTTYDAARIAAIKKAMAAGENPIQYKKELGRVIVSMYYDEAAALQAQEEFERVFTDKGLPDDIPGYEFNWHEPKIWLPRLLADLKIMSGTGAAVRMIKQGGVYLDGERVADQNFEIEVEKEWLLRVGKRGFYRLKGMLKQ
ncbi:MAG: tyrosine--tRNA ligase [candidate division Zixibacteria bacterium]|nr:tyrosine--tRNA ligase [candidate division Zixibacteria bacterium]